MNRAALTPALDAALAEGHRIGGMLKAMKRALEKGDDAKALTVARELCGLKQEPHAPDPSR